MKVVDSSGWLEFFTAGPLIDDYAEHLADLDELITPVVVVYEVYKRVKRERGEEQAMRVVAQLQKTRVEPLTVPLALSAADVSLEIGLAMADAQVYATAVAHGAELVTSDSDFEGVDGVTYLSKG